MFRTQISIFIFSYFITTSLSEKVTWLPNINFNLPMNFDTKLCSKKTVIFPETLAGSVVIDSDTSVNEFILPNNGDIFLGEGASIELGSGEEPDCKAGYVHYRENTEADWSRPDVWSSVRINDATPDAERVPCFDDVVIFPPNSTFTVILPDVVQKVQAVELGGENINDFLEYFASKHSNQGQTFILNEYHESGVSIGGYLNTCHSRSGCPCQTNTLKIDCSAKLCKKPTCADSIKPIGHCCRICGGAIVVDIDETFDFLQFQLLIEKIIDTYGKDKFIYHIGRLPDNKVQVIVLDKNGYDQTSAEVVSAISYNMEKDLRHDMQVSGSPLSKSGLGGKLFVCMFFAVILVMAGIYAYYYKLPQMNYPIITGRSQANMFSRFNRRTESVVSLTRRDSTPIGDSTATAFRNPLYDSQRSRVSVEESILEE
ncbi:protein amnionless [Bicyclus anynana]|uniref:Protein amnionless n=1 Tax=Bicyclus anynana TaxID=110368 RepID=A0A6J1N0B2_BICAN|nr:protein amnionless [Bicyclus anynana]